MNRKLINHFLPLSAALAFFPCTTAHAQMPIKIDEKVTAEIVTAPPSAAKPTKWSFSECVDWAISNSTEIRRNILSILQADENIGAAKDAWLPSVGFSMNHNFTNYPSPNDGNRSNIYGSNYGVNASWTVWEGNIRKYRLESAKITRRQQELAGDDAAHTIKLGILQAYLNIMYAREAVEIATQTLQVSTSQTERAKRLMESGRTSKVDFAQIESQMAQDTYNLVQAESNVESAKMNLKKILELGIDYNLEIEDVDFSDSEVLASLPEMNDVFSFASSWQPSFKSNDLSKDIYENDIKIAKAGRAPEIALTGGVSSGYTSGGPAWGTQMGHNLNESVGLSFSIPIYDANATKRKVAQAKLSALEYDLANESLLNNLSQTIESLYIDARNAKAKFLSGQTQLEATGLTADLVNRQFELGLVNPLELLTAHNNLLNARLEMLQNKYMAILANKTITYYATTQISLP